MRISIRAYGLLQDTLGAKDWIEVDVEAGTTLEEFLVSRKLEMAQVMLVLNKGRTCAMDCLVQDGDRLEVLPLIAGG